MTSVVLAAAIMAGMGLLFASILAVAYRFLRVPEDPRVEQVEGMLPGTNCGACGQPGCRAFAESVVNGASAPSALPVFTKEEAYKLFFQNEASDGALLRRSCDF